MSKGDILAGLIIGELSSWLILAIFRNVRVEFALLWTLPIILPILSAAGLFAADFLGKKFAIIWQAAKFGLVGVLNTLIDLGVLNILIFISGTASGLGFSLFKGISFTVAVINSYVWNKYWTFRVSKAEAVGGEKAREFLQFFVVSAIGFGINVGTASAVVNLIGPQFGLAENLWANVGAIAATFLGMSWNFLGYKFIVFKK